MRQIVAIGSLKGAPGASTLALALAAVWPAGGVRPVVVEADAAGGDLAVRFGLSDMTGLLTLAAGARHGGVEAELGRCTQEAAGGLRVVVAPTGCDQALASVAELAACPRVLRGDPGSEGIVLLDLGHLGAGPSRELAGLSDQLVLVAGGSADALAHVAARPQWLEGARVELAVVGECRYSEFDIAKALEVGRDQIHVLPWDVRAAAALSGVARVAERRWGRLPLAQAAFALARQLAGADGDTGGGGLCGELAQLGSRALAGARHSRTEAVRTLETGGIR
ncbi:MinD/ParA family ATP-binding protein [Streptomyces violascens]|uniref:MinD/ParA family ATP-binding protein n=1 Tax=Streptomyces violascens TaxID=67381 RepID=UPI003659444F